MAKPDDCLSDADLIAQLQSGGLSIAAANRSFELLYERYREPIRRRLLGIVRNQGATEDLLQEVFLKVWQRAEQWSGQGSFEAWLYRIAVNQALNWLRSRRRQPDEPFDLRVSVSEEGRPDDDEPSIPGWMLADSAASPATILERAERSASLRGMIRALPQEKREILRLVYELELSLGEAADALGIPLGTAKSRLHYAQKQLQQEWGD